MTEDEQAQLWQAIEDTRDIISMLVETMKEWGMIETTVDADGEIWYEMIDPPSNKQHTNKQ